MRYRNAKRGLNSANDASDDTYRKLENGFETYMACQAEAIMNLDDDSQEDKLVKGYRIFRTAKQNHDFSRTTLRNALDHFKSIEMQYSLVILNGLRKAFHLKLTDLANIFGIWQSALSRWLKADRERELKEVYEAEYGGDETEDT